MAGLISSYIPLDLVYDILLTLPVKSLLRFNLVSKPVRNIITKQDFIKKQLQTSMESKTHLKLILHRLQEIYAWDLDKQPNQAVLLRNPLPSGCFSTKIGGSCYGLVLLYIPFDEIALWNPFTRVYKILPVCPVISSEAGFGYDSVNEDYKVVRILVTEPKTKFCVYSLRFNSWHWKDFPYNGYYFYINDLPVAFVDGALHWVVYRVVGEVEKKEIVAFNLTNETFLIYPFPDGYPEKIPKLFSFEGCLSLSLQTVCFPSESHLYVMKKQGDEITWTKLFTFLQKDCVDLEVWSVIPLMISKDGNRVLLVQYQKNLSWYDQEKKRGEKADIANAPFKFGSSLCWESLVSPGNEDSG